MYYISWRRSWSRIIFLVPIITVLLTGVLRAQYQDQDILFKVVEESTSTSVSAGGVPEADTGWDSGGPPSEDDDDYNASNFSVSEVTWQAIDFPLEESTIGIEDPVANAQVHVIAEGKTAGVLGATSYSPLVYIKCQNQPWIYNDMWNGWPILRCFGWYWSVAHSEVTFGEEDANGSGPVVFGLHAQLAVTGGSQAGLAERELQNGASVAARAGSCLIQATYSAANDEWYVHIEVPSVDIEWEDDGDGGVIYDISESVEVTDKIVPGKNLNEHVFGESVSFFGYGSSGELSASTNIRVEQPSNGASETDVEAAAWATGYVFLGEG